MKLLNRQVQEAIYIASPVLYAELQKYLKREIPDESERKRIEFSLYRYINRMSSRSTPFGLFAGCSVGKTAGDKTVVLLDDNFNRHTRLDMYFLCTLAQELSKKAGIKENLRYYPNTSLYLIGRKYRYIEYHYIKQRRIHRISSVERSVYLDEILKTAKKGTSIDDLLNVLINREIEKDKALCFIQELIDSQVIVNELNPSVTGEDFFTRMIHVLENIHAGASIIGTLQEMGKTLNLLDTNSVNNLNLYQNIIHQIQAIHIPYEEKMLFQVDMTRTVSEATLGKAIMDELLSTLTFLNKITPTRTNENLVQFQQAFYNRYEEQEIPLMEALDFETGVGYPVNSGSGDITPLLDNFYIQGQTTQSSAFQSVLSKKLRESLSEQTTEVILTDNDAKNIHASWEDLSPTIYSLFEIIRADPDNLLIRLSGFCGSCGANLMARFAHTDENISRFVMDITAKERALMPDVVFAEIVHLPDSRVGNILARPHLRDYEIPYLAHSDLPEKQQIPLSDLYLSIRQGKIYLRSKKLNKEIVPRLTNAHNFHNNSMLVYRFLCDMQMQQGRGILSFDWGYLSNEFDFLPRVRYKNTILSVAQWKFKAEEIKKWFSIKEDRCLLEEIKKWRNKYALPRRMLLPDNDNELMIDWENILNIRSLFSIIKNRQTVSFKELLYEPEYSAVWDKQGNPYANECIVALYKNKKQ